MDQYIAVINLDFTDQDSNGYAEVVSALIQAGWSWVETSALVYEGEIGAILVALDVLSKGVLLGGRPSAVTVQFQMLGAEKEYAALKNHGQALANIRARPNP